jgi:hypothetical protein
MSIRKENYLYAIVFDKPIRSKASLISILKAWGCEAIAHGPTEYSIEFRLNTSKWAKDRWIEWELLIDRIYKSYCFNKNCSCLPVDQAKRSR